MMIRKTAHISLVVSDMNRSLDFYKDILGFNLIKDKEVQGEKLSKALGLANVKLRIAILKQPADDILLELIEYKTPVAKNIPLNTPDILATGHIAFNVDNIHLYYSELKNKGVEFISEPQKLPDGVAFCYFKDPDGAFLELIEFPD